MQLNTTKAVLLGLGIACVALLIGVEAVSSEAGLPILTAWMGYAVGNGVGAKAGAVAPLVRPRWDGIDRRSEP